MLDFFVSWLLDIPENTKCMSMADLLRNVVTESDRSCASNLLSHSLTIQRNSSSQ